MKIIKRIVVLLIVVILIISSWLLLRDQGAEIQRDEFLNKFPMLNYEILGELTYDDPDLDLETLGFKEYPELFNKIDIIEDYEKIINFIKDDESEEKFTIKRNTFIICVRSLEYILIVCDDADTPSTDKVHTERPVPDLEDFYAEFVNNQVK